MVRIYAQLTHVNAAFAGRIKFKLDDGFRRAGDRLRLLRSVDRLRLRLRCAVRADVMIFDYSLAAFVTAGLLIYLVYALLKPELF